MKLLENLIYLIDQIPDNYRPAVLTSSATLIGAFFGAMTAQYISHLFTVRRDNQKTAKEIYQKLYAPILLDIYAYLDISSHFRRGHDIKFGVREDDILVKIKEHVGTNLIYASPKLIDKYSTVWSFYYQDDLSGFSNKIQDLELIELLLLELRMLSKKIKFFDKQTMKKIDQMLVLYRVWSILIRYYHGSYQASATLSYKFYYDRNKLNYKTYKKIIRYFTNNTLKYRINLFINNLEEKIEKNSNLHKLYKNIYKKIFGEFSLFERFQNLRYLYSLLSGKENLEELIKVSERNDYSYDSHYMGPPYINELLIFCHEISYNNYLLTIEVEMRNCSETIKNICIDNFLLLGD
ncbi:hypothetical protein QJ48_29795, partial [Paenibacillus sp. A3]